MVTYTTCSIRRSSISPYPMEAFWQNRKIYTSQDPLHMVTEKILNHFGKQGWELHQTVLATNGELLLIFKK